MSKQAQHCFRWCDSLEAPIHCDKAVPHWFLRPNFLFGKFLAHYDLLDTEFNFCRRQLMEEIFRLQTHYQEPWQIVSWGTFLSTVEETIHFLDTTLAPILRCFFIHWTRFALVCRVIVIVTMKLGIAGDLSKRPSFLKSPTNSQPYPSYIKASRKNLTRLYSSLSFTEWARGSGGYMFPLWCSTVLRLLGELSMNRRHSLGLQAITFYWYPFFRLHFPTTNYVREIFPLHIIQSAVVRIHLLMFYLAELA